MDIVGQPGPVNDPGDDPMEVPEFLRRVLTVHSQS